MKLEFVGALFSVCKLAADAPQPDWVRGDFVSISRSDQELSIVADLDCVPDGIEREDGWRCIRVAGKLDFGLVGVLAGLCGTLADAEISIFAVSTFDTDYLMIKDVDIADARKALVEAGFEFV